MGRGPKPTKGKAKPAIPRKAQKHEDARVHDLEKRLAEALEREAGALKREAEAHEQQAATSEILSVISSSPTDVQPVFDAIASRVVRLCDGFFSTVWRYDGTLIHHAADNYPTEEMRAILTKGYPAPAQPGSAVAQAISERRIIHVADLLDGSAPAASREVAIALGYRTVLCVPMLREGVSIGAIAVARRKQQPFSERQIALVKTFADQAVIAIENVRLFKELEARNRDLTESLEQQMATSEILRAISSSPIDVQPVMQTIVESASRLADAEHAMIGRAEGDHIRWLAAAGAPLSGLPQGISLQPISRSLPTGRAILDRQTTQVEDISVYGDEFPGVATAYRELGVRTILATPLLREGNSVGVILIRRTAVRPFTDQQIALLKTFADQAVIAIENVRLFKELEARNRDLTESLEQQTATSEILNVISRSPTDPAPVFDVIIRNAVRLCGGLFGCVFRFDGERLHLVAHHNFTPEAQSLYERVYPIQAARDQLLGPIVLEQRVMNVADVLQTVRNPLGQQLFGFRSGLGVPMVRDNTVIGAIAVSRTTVGLFPDTQVELLRTFADQAVIAIENVRLFTELQEKNRALTQAHAQVTEALEQQTATSEILRVISGSPTDVQPVLNTLAASSARLCEAQDTHIYLVDGDVLRLAAHHGPLPSGVVGESTLPLIRGTLNGRAVIERRVAQIADLQNEVQEFPEGAAAARRYGHRTALIVPLLREGVAIGTISLRRAEVRLFSERQIALLQTFADQAVIAIENVRLFKELQEKNRALTEAHAKVSDALERQTATADILRAISQTQTDVQPVFEVIADSAMRLLGAWSASVWRYESDVIRLSAVRGGLPGSGEAFLEQRHVARHPADDSPASQTVLTRTVFHSVDVETDRTWGPQYRAEARMRGFRSIVAVPMLHGDEALGVIAVTRTEVGGFAPAEIALLQTFADQAVIAVENTRLLSELQARTQELTRSVGELRALGEVGRAVSSTLDLETVLTTIVSRAVQLADLEAGAIYEYDEAAEVFHLRATQNLPEEFLQVARPLALPKGEGATGRLAVTREPVQIPDITAPDAYHGRMRDVLLRMGHRALLAVPLISEDHIVGGLVVNRRQPGEFAPEVIELLRTFATQSALAIQNARLFREIEVKSRELAAASQHKSEFLANMSHELRTPLNAIIGFSEVLSEKMFGELNEKQEEYSKDIHASGNHLLSLINDILDLSKIEAGRMELELSDFHLPTALDSALTLIRERAGRRSIALHLSVDERLSQIQADERKVRQVVLNLLSNAIKFTPEGGRIEVLAAPKDGFVEVSVTDTGVGIAPEDQEAVFEEFRQVGTADKKVEGTGLGLTLCRKFVELHGGRISVKSQLGQGSTFTFTIPVHHGE
jgi:GAF domain-containing protein